MKSEAERGLYNRYQVLKTNGDSCDPNAEYFVLRLDGYGNDIRHIQACRKAVLRYAEEIKSHLPKLADDLIQKYGEGSNPVLTPASVCECGHSKEVHQEGGFVRGRTLTGLTGCVIYGCPCTKFTQKVEKRECGNCSTDCHFVGNKEHNVCELWQPQQPSVVAQIKRAIELDKDYKPYTFPEQPRNEGKLRECCVNCRYLYVPSCNGPCRSCRYNPIDSQSDAKSYFEPTTGGVVDESKQPRNEAHPCESCPEKESCQPQLRIEPCKLFPEKRQPRNEGKGVIKQNAEVFMVRIDEVEGLDQRLSQLEGRDYLPLMQKMLTLITLNTTMINSMPEISIRRKDEMWGIKDKCWDMLTKLQGGGK
jgi:hypothetical protein